MPAKTAKQTKKRPDSVDLFEQLDSYFSRPDAMSKSAFAELAGISRVYLYALLDRESDPAYSVAKRIAHAMDCEISCIPAEKICQV